MSNVRPTDTAARDAAPALGVGLVLAVIAIILANTNVGDGENGGTGPMVGTLIFIIVVAALMYFLLLPRASSATVGIVIGVIAVVTVAAYWSGLPFVLGATGFVMGRRSTSGARAVVVQVLGVVAVVAGIVAVIADKAS
jgi:hypothetical protein